MRLFKKRKNTSSKPLCHIGDFSYYGGNIRVVNPESVIGKYCSIGENVQLGLNWHDMALLTTSPIVHIREAGKTIDELKKFPPMQNQEFIKFQNKKQIPDKLKPVHIGNDVWCGNNVIIFGGLTIGDGAVIGAGSVVTHDVPPYSVVAGVPARIIRYRFDEKTIKELLKLKWWNYSEDIISQLPIHNIDKCIKILNGKNNAKN